MEKEIEKSKANLSVNTEVAAQKNKPALFWILSAGIVGLTIPLLLPAIGMLIQYLFFDYHRMDLAADLERFPKINLFPSFGCCLIFSLAAMVSNQTAKQKKTTFTQALILLGLSAIASFFLSNILVYNALIHQHRKTIDPLGPTHAIVFLFLIIAIPTSVAFATIYWSNRTQS